MDGDMPCKSIGCFERVESKYINDGSHIKNNDLGNGTSDLGAQPKPATPRIK